MAHASEVKATAACDRRNEPLDRDAIRRLRVDPSACFRMAASLGLQERIFNHFSAVVPGGRTGETLSAWPFAGSRPRSLLCDFHGNVAEGDGTPEAPAFNIHARLHALKPATKGAFHTHMPHPTA